jgi:hypothetical protein
LGEIEQPASSLFEIRRELARIGGSGKFATRRTAAANDLNLEVRGIGRIRFPITPHTARRLCAVARPAHHGFKDETRLDKRVRNTWEIAKSGISIDQPRWSKAMVPQLERIGKDLGMPTGSRLKAELHNLLVYAPGQFFAPHQDSEKAEDMIGTLAVSLPSRFTGGIMSIEHHGAKLRVAGSESPPADRSHAAEPVPGHVLAGISHTAKRAGDGVLAHGTLATADAREGRLVREPLCCVRCGASGFLRHNLAVLPYVDRRSIHARSLPCVLRSAPQSLSNSSSEFFGTSCL